MKTARPKDKYGVYKPKRPILYEVWLLIVQSCIWKYTSSPSSLLKINHGIACYLDH